METIDENPKDLLTSEFDPFLHHNDATRGQRLINFIIDNVFMRITITYITGYAVGYILGSLFPEFTRNLIDRNNYSSLLILGYVIVIFNYIIYYTLCEKLFNGRTLGKLLTGTKAIREDGSDLTLRDAFLRSVSRLVPFEAFSGLGVPWHDSWTNTRVVKTR